MFVYYECGEVLWSGLCQLRGVSRFVYEVCGVAMVGLFMLCRAIMVGAVCSWVMWSVQHGLCGVFTIYQVCLWVIGFVHEFMRLVHEVYYEVMSYVMRSWVVRVCHYEVCGVFMNYTTCSPFIQSVHALYGVFILFLRSNSFYFYLISSHMMNIPLNEHHDGGVRVMFNYNNENILFLGPFNLKIRVYCY